MKAQLDELVKTLVDLPRQYYLSSGACKEMPRLLWKDGITTLSELTASAKTGIMFTIIVLGMTKPGKDFFESAFGNTTIYCNMMECFQMILCYWMWLKKPSFWSRTVTHRKDNAKQAPLLLCLN